MSRARLIAGIDRVKKNVGPEGRPDRFGFEGEISLVPGGWSREESIKQGSGVVVSVFAARLDRIPESEGILQPGSVENGDQRTVFIVDLTHFHRSGGSPTRADHSKVTTTQKGLEQGGLPGVRMSDDGDFQGLLLLHEAASID